MEPKHESSKSKIVISRVLSSRYPSDKPRPRNWDSRIGGIDVVETEDGQTLKLQSDGMQSVPAKGWGIIIVGGDKEAGFKWTLYSLPREVEASHLPS